MTQANNKKNKEIVSVILSGGSGTRLWPLSRASFPKQLLPLFDGNSLLQASAKRLWPLSSKSDCQAIDNKPSVLIIANNRHRFMIAEQLQLVDIKADILLEPIARNTAPAIALAAWKLFNEARGDALMVVMPSDHLIKNIEKFNESVEQVMRLAEHGNIVTFGIKPSHPETGYGYINVKTTQSQTALWDVEKFVEKPNKETANAYLSSGDYFWNSGIFCFTAETILQEFKQYQPNIYAQTKRAMDSAVNDLDFIRIDGDAFARCDDVSIDYAIMEKSQNIKMMVADFDWCDLGSWHTMKSIYPKDNQGNVVLGKSLVHNSSHNFIHSKNRLVAALGVDNLSIIDTEDALLVMNNDCVDAMPYVIEQLTLENNEVLKEGVVDYRPWGYFRLIQKGERYQVKLIVVNSGASLSLQKHQFRSEHWVVVKGEARVVVGDEEKTLNENQSVYVPIGAMHRLTNPGKEALHLIEVQTGSYLGEDDIVRFDDVYNRSSLYDDKQTE